MLYSHTALLSFCQVLLLCLASYCVCVYVGVCVHMHVHGACMQRFICSPFRFCILAYPSGIIFFLAEAYPLQVTSQRTLVVGLIIFKCFIFHSFKMILSDVKQLLLLQNGVVHSWKKYLKLCTNLLSSLHYPVQFRS